MLTQERLKEFLSYDKNTGIFTWNVSTNNSTKIDSKAGYLRKAGYIGIKIDYKTYQAHRLAWLYVYEKFPKGDIDHINRIRNDNRISNLRDVSRSLNLRNSSISKRNTSGTTGVFWNKGANKWVSHITYGGKERHLGCFKNKDDAIKARKEAEVLYGYL